MGKNKKKSKKFYIARGRVVNTYNIKKNKKKDKI